MRHLARLKNLVVLGIDENPKITDVGLKELRGLSNLEQLYLIDTGITEDGLRHLAGMKKLSSLAVGGYPIRAKGVAHLEKLRGLKALFLQRCQLTDENLLALRTLANLTKLYVDGNELLTPAGIARLQKELPKLRVFRTDGTLPPEK